MKLAEFNMALTERHKQIDAEVDKMMDGQDYGAQLASRIYRAGCHMLEDARSEDKVDPQKFALMVAEQVGNVVAEMVSTVSDNRNLAASLAKAMYTVSAQRTASLLPDIYERRKGQANAPTTETPH